MILDFLLDHVLLILAIWVVLYVSDYQLTITSARHYRQVLQEIAPLEGSFEITPLYQGDVDALRRVSPRFLIMLVLSCLVLWLLWVSTRSIGERVPLEMGVGALFLLEVVVHMRHARNLVTTYYSRRGGVKGRLEQARWLMLRVSATDLATYAALFFLLFLLTGSWFVLGGAIGCLINAVLHWYRAGAAH